ncbi:MAG TPA: signal peptidase I [Burkholderiales bacterium]|nr:signal peptidase I [Burkholderiales bacterium]
MESTETYHKPSRRIAAVLGFFLPPAGMLYVARPGRAAIYLALLLVIAAASLFVARAGAVAAALVAIVCAVQSYGFARDFREVKRPWYSHGPGLLVVIAALAGLALGALAFLVEPFQLRSASMQPSIEPGDRLIVKKWGYGNYGILGIHFMRAPASSQVRRGDVVVFESPENKPPDNAKRVVGVPGDRVAYFSKRLWVNEQEVPRTRIGDYVRKEGAGSSLQYLERLGEREYPVLIEAEAIAFVPPAKAFPFQERCTYTKEGVSCGVPDGHYFVLGDNRDNSVDSRTWGFVPAGNIVGKVLVILP